LGQDNFGFITGKSITVVGISTGIPREMMWRTDVSVSRIVSHPGTRRMVVIPEVAEFDIEVVDITNPSNFTSLKNPSMAKVVDVCFTRDGDVLYAISGPLDPKVFAWNLRSHEIVFIADAPANFLRLSINPADKAKFVLSGNEDLYMASIVDVMDSSTVKFEKVDLEAALAGRGGGAAATAAAAAAAAAAQSTADGNAVTAPTLAAVSATFTEWAPFERLFVGTSTGLIVEISAVDLSIKVRVDLQAAMVAADMEKKGPCVPLCATISTTNVIVGTSTGAVYWYPIVDPEAVLLLEQPNNVGFIQSAFFEGSISCLGTDPLYRTVLAGTNLGVIYRFPLEILDIRGEEEDEGGETNAEAERVTKVVEDVSNRVIEGMPICVMQSDAVLAAKAFPLPVLSTSENTTKTSVTYCSIFVTGSHSGTLTFWKQPPVDSEAIAKDTAAGGGPPGIRRSLPRVVKTVGSVEVTGESGAGSLAGRKGGVAIATLDCLQFNQKTGYALLMVGTVEGWFEAWKICAYEAEEQEAETAADDEDAAIKLNFVKYFRRLIYHSALSLISTSIEEKKFFSVALGSFAESQLYIIKIPSDFEAAATLSFAVNLHASPSSCVWVGRTFWIGCHNGSMCSFVPSRTEKGVVECEAHGFWETSLPAIANACPASKGECLVVSCPELLNLRLFPVSADSGGTSRSNAFADAALQFKSAQKDSALNSDTVVCLAGSPNGNFVGAGCVDGSIQVWNASGGDLKLAARIAVHRLPVIAIVFSVDSSLMMSCGADGSVFLSTVSAPSRIYFKAALGDTKVYDRVIVHEDDVLPIDSAASEGTQQTWFEVYKVEALEDMKKKHAAKVAEVKSAVDDITSRLRNILERNDGRSEEIEKLARSDLVVDLNGRDKTLAANDALLTATRQTYGMRNLWNELCASRVREVCWDAMESHERRILPFSADDRTFISSFSIRRPSDDFKRRLAIIKRLRAIEIRSQRAHPEGVAYRLPGTEGNIRTCWAKAISGFSSTTSWIANDGTRWPSQDVIGMLLRSEKAEEAADSKPKGAEGAPAAGHPPADAAAGGDAAAVAAGGTTDAVDFEVAEGMNLVEPHHEIDETNLFNLLFPPQVIRTEVQKRSQIILLTEISRLLRANFNKFFEELAQEKEDVIAAIDSRNQRLQAILEELKEHEELFAPKLSNFEVKGAVITITDEELSSRPYESAAARAARLAEEEARRKREAEADTEDVKGRALDEMMHGTLEVKRDVLADMSAMAKPAWMEELSPSEMNEAQLKEYDAFEAKIKAMQEEQLKYRKALEVEMKKLKAESAEACKAFDEKVSNAARIKVMVQREILTQELYISRLGLSMAKREQLWVTLKNTELQIESMRKERAELRSRTEQFSQHVESMKTTLATLDEEGKNLDKTFKRDLQQQCPNFNFDQENLKIFYDLYRRREFASTGEEEEEGSAEEDDGGFDASQSQFGTSKAGRRSQMSRSSRNSRSQASRSQMQSRKQKQSTMKSSKKQSTMSSSKKGAAGSSRIMKASKGGGNATSTMGAINKGALGPMQAAAMAMKEAEQENVQDRDPFFVDLVQKEKAVRIAEAKIPLMTDLNIDDDCPEGFYVDQPTWQKLRDLRFNRMDKEIQAKRLAIEFTTQKRKLDDLMAEEAALVACIGALRQARDETQGRLQSIDSNLEVLVCLKQGQDEVDKDAVVTEYSDAILVPTEAVQKFNVRIKELGKEKIGMLSKIKHFRRKINLTEWNSDHLVLQSKNMEEYFMDFQLLRVTRELQQVIRDGSNADQAKERLDKVSIRRDFLQKDAESKVEKMHKSIDALRRQLADREEESSVLERRIRDLKVDVAARKNIKDSNSQTRGATQENPVNAAAEKMKKVMARRHLLDSARAQAEEADFLRQELDRLRQRTFPSFVKATKQHLPGSADDR
jgi:WD40 repeat protein